MEVHNEPKTYIWKGCRKASPSILDLGKLPVQKLSLGRSHYAVLFTCGKLLLFGNNKHGQLGVGDNFSTSAEPLPGHFFIDVACGNDHTASVEKDGSVVCWGNNLLQQCGSSEKHDFIGPCKVNFSPTKVDSDIKIVQVACGHFHTLALSESGVVWSWGFGAQLGLGKVHNTHVPMQIESLKPRKVLSIACGAFHSIALVSSEMTCTNQLLTDMFDDLKHHETFNTDEGQHDSINSGGTKDKRSRLCNSHSLSDVQTPYVPKVNTSISFDHTFELELTSCPCPIIKTIQETPDEGPSRLLPRSPISELMLEEETSFVNLCNFNGSKEADAQSVCLLDDTGDATYDLISLNEDIPSAPCNSAADVELSTEHVPDSSPKQHQLSLYISTSTDMPDSVKRTLSLEDKPTKSTSSGWNSIPGTCSSFLDEFKAKEFLQRQLECVNPLVPESLPNYGFAIQSKFESASSAVKMLASNDPLSKKFETLLQHVPSPPGVVQEYVSQLTKTVVSNIKTSVDKIVSTAPIEALTEGVSGGVMEVVKMAKKRSLADDAGIRDSSAADLNRLCVKNSTLNSSDAVSKSTSMNPIDVGRMQTHHRNVSLPTGTLESLPDVFRGHSKLICWDTEVWSWGEGSKGQLGLADTMDRDVPQLMEFFSHAHISQVSVGHSHNVALSHSGQVFAWGDNANNQLGQSKVGLSSTPLLLEVQGGLPCWSVAAGDKHTLIACDGLDYSTRVFYCGYDFSCSEDKLTHVKRMMSVGDLKKMGVVQEIYSGGEMSGCLVREVREDDVVRNAVHDLSCSERFFCLTLKRIISAFLQPLIQKLDVNECNGLMIGTAKTEDPVFNSHWSHCFRLLFSKLSCLQQLVARNQCDLKHWIQLESSNPKAIPIVRDSEKFVTAYASYFKAYCDAVACLCFKSCIKSNKDFFDMILDDFSKFLEDEKFSPTDPSLNLQNLMKLPYYRLRDYQKTLDRIAEYYPAYTSTHADLQRVLQMWRRLRQTSDNDLSTATITAFYWTSASPKLMDMLQNIPSRRLVRDGKIFPLNLNSGGGPRLFSWSSFVLFNDCFVQIQYSNHVIFPLQIIWLEISPDSKTLKNAITLTMPEEILVLTAPTHSEKAEWVWCLQQTIKTSLSSAGKNMDIHCLGPPIERHATYTFQKSGWLKDATYNGQWRNALMHGKGELKWARGKKYIGNFVNGQMEGHGTMTIPRDDGIEVQDGTWKSGQLHGFGVVRYSNGDIYRGYFIDGKRHGHGIMKQGKFTTTSASIYYGQWAADKRSGYGVFDDIPRGQKYMGQWSDDVRHGNGLVVTLDGYYFEGNFINGKMSGRGLFINEDNHFFEGDFSGFAFSGKGTLTFPNGDFIEGSFGGNFSDGVKINGTLRKNCENLRSGQNMFNQQSLPHLFGKMAYSAEGKWQELYRQCYSALGCNREKVNEDCSEVWNKVASFMAHNSERNINRSPAICTNLHSVMVDDDMNVIPSYCQLTLTYPIWKNIKSYLTKAFEHPNHPLGFLLSSLVDVYLATYVGVTAHVRLLFHATLELKAYVENIYSVVRHLFPQLPTTSCLLVITDDMRESDDSYKINRFRATPQALLHPIIIPKVYPPLFNLFVIHNEKNDEKYRRRACLWNKQTDQALLTYLDVDRKYHLLDRDLVENSIKRSCYHEAVECLQRISTSFTPFEKMLQIHSSFHEINMAVEKSLGRCPQWSMDELFPVFWFVVVRSRIQHLGAEIHFIEELMEKYLENGEMGLMFTTLKACYFQILNEKPV